jgi:hypothetical protein
MARSMARIISICGVLEEARCQDDLDEAHRDLAVGEVGGARGTSVAGGGLGALHLPADSAGVNNADVNCSWDTVDAR